MKAHDKAPGEQGGADERTALRANEITTRLGAVALPLAIIVLVVSSFFHPSREDPMDNPAVFLEYAHSDSWIAVHLVQYFGFLLLIGGLVALYYSVSAKSAVGAVVARFGLAAALTTAASFTVLQAVDGIAQTGWYLYSYNLKAWRLYGRTPRVPERPQSCTDPAGSS